jgi:FimV-like protein
MPEKRKPAKTKTSVVTGREHDVAATGESSLASPRHLLWLLVAAGLIALVALWWRRRQYKPVPLDTGADSDAPSNANTNAQSLPIAPVIDPEPTAAVITDTVPEPAPAEPEPAPPAMATETADAYLQVGEFSQARALLEAKLERKPQDGRLQDKLLEVDYRAGDARRFSEDVARFEQSLKTNGLRWANVAAMGRVLLPGDARFEIEALDDISTAQNPTVARAGDAAVADDTEHPQPAARAPSDGNSSNPAYDTDAQPSSNAGNSSAQSSFAEGLELDIQSARFEDDDGPPKHDHSAPGEGGLEIDKSEDDPKNDDESPHLAAAPLEMIDPGEFDLGADECPAEALAADTLEARLDLARVYLEMGDEPMARELLEEVIAHGEPAQCGIARALLESL